MTQITFTKQLKQAIKFLFSPINSALSITLDHFKEKKATLGEVLNGDRLVNAPYKLDFLVDKDSEVVCKKKMTKDEIVKFRDATSKDYYFQMYYDDMPIWGFIGRVETEGKHDPNEYNMTRKQFRSVKKPGGNIYTGTYLGFQSTGPCSRLLLDLAHSCLSCEDPRIDRLPVLWATAFDVRFPCHTSQFPREVPRLPWYRGTLPQMAVAGLLPLSGIYIELYYIYGSVWGHRIYTTYGLLFVIFIILIIVTAFTTVALTYFQLAAEDHNWWWRSFLCGCSTGLFIYGYCFYYHYVLSDMTGFMQSSFFFGYMACICYGFFLMLGTVGFQASLFFIRHIYRSIKCE